MNLFSDTETETETCDDPENLTGTARELVNEFAYDPKAVARWSPEKRETILRKRHLQRKRDVHHGNAKAAEQKESTGPREPNACELTARREAARMLEQELASGDAQNLEIALTFAMYPLSNHEQSDFARLLIIQLRTHPLSGEPNVAPKAASGEAA